MTAWTVKEPERRLPAPPRRKASFEPGLRLRSSSRRIAAVPLQFQPAVAADPVEAHRDEDVDHFVGDQQSAEHGRAIAEMTSWPTPVAQSMGPGR